MISMSEKETKKNTYKKKKSDSAYRIPPQSGESEMALLGSIMLKSDALHDIAEFVSEDVFYFGKHKTIYKAILELLNKGDPVDLLTLSNKLQEQGTLEDVGGRVYLTELTKTVPSSANIEYYAKIVYKKYMLRKLIDASNEISQIGYEDSLEIEEAIDKAEKSVFDISKSLNAADIKSLSDALPEAFERFDRLSKTKNELRGVPTGFASLDNKLSGFQKSDLIILAARPSMGKTSFALNIAKNVAVKHNIPVCIFSLEMSTQQLVDRMIASEAKVDSWKLRTGNLSETGGEIDNFRNALDSLSRAPIFIDDQPANNVLKMRSVARKLKRQKDLGLIIVDYLQLMAPTQSKANDSMVQQVTELSRSLKHLARDLDVPVLALSQLSRAVEQRGGRPRLSDLRDSGSIEQDADVVMFIHREDKYNENSDKPNIAEILIEKHRNGPTGKVDLYFEEKNMTFMNIDKSDFSDFENVNEDF